MAHSVMQRRAFAVSIGMVGLLAACTSPTNDASLALAKTYLDAGSKAVLAAAQEFLAGPPAPATGIASTVTGLMTELTSVISVLDSTALAADWKSGALQAVSLVQQLSPLVASSLGAAAPYVALALAVVTAFITALPTPPNTPTVPPAQLTRKAAQYAPR